MDITLGIIGFGALVFTLLALSDRNDFNNGKGRHKRRGGERTAPGPAQPARVAEPARSSDGPHLLWEVEPYLIGEEVFWTATCTCHQKVHGLPSVNACGQVMEVHASLASKGLA